MLVLGWTALAVYLWMLIVLCSSAWLVNSEEEFSGVYSPNIKKTGSAEDFAAAWLITRERFLASRRFIASSTNMAGVSFAITRARCTGCYTMLSRDYFDFLVEHLSTTSNQIPHSDKVVFQIYYDRIRKVVKELQNVAHAKPETDPRLHQTLATLIYSSITFSRPQASVQASIREPYFEATFWSVYRYIPNIIIFVASDLDRIAVESMELPVVEILQLEVPFDHKNRTVALPRYSLAYVDTHMREALAEEGTEAQEMKLRGPPVSQKRTLTIGNSSQSWSQFKYVFFSEGDQILHMRQAAGLYDALDAGQGKIVVVPHRMQTLPLMQTLPRQTLMEQVYKKAHHLNLPNSTIVTLDLAKFTGSCCDAGRYTVTECGQWWYQCPDWGLKDINPWFQFGADGFTTPPATAHKGACAYTPERVVCSLPLECRHRTPVPVPEDEEFVGKGVCEETPTRTRLGPLVAPPLKKKKKPLTLN